MQLVLDNYSHRLFIFLVTRIIRTIINFNITIIQIDMMSKIIIIIKIMDVRILECSHIPCQSFIVIKHNLITLKFLFCGSMCIWVEVQVLKMELYDMRFQLSEIEDVSGEIAIEITTSRERKHENYREFSYEFPYYSSLFPSSI